MSHNNKTAFSSKAESLTNKKTVHSFKVESHSNNNKIACSSKAEYLINKKIAPSSKAGFLNNNNKIACSSKAGSPRTKNQPSYKAK